MMKSILLVEDDRYISDIYSTKLKKAGFSVSIAADGQDCLNKIKEKMPDLLLLDIVLPSIDGWEILKKIKEEKGLNRLSKLKIVIISNLGQKEEVEKGIKLGAMKYLIKAQYTPSQVVEEIKKILK